MTEAEWLACTDLVPMLEFLEAEASDRKLRLFGCACCRQVWESLTEDCFRDAVEVAERFADGKASRKELALAKKTSGAALEGAGVTGPRYCALGSAWSSTRNPPTAAIYPLWVFTDEADRKWEIQFLRDIFGNPFRPVTADPSWLAWNESTVRKIAQAIYEERAFEQLPVLADALEDAGCDDADLLAHCRGDGPHVRGCWVIDLLLGKG
jgi:hypothetical protein